MNLEEIGKAIGRIPSGLFVLTAHFKGQDSAVLVSWVNQCSFEPPTVSVALSGERPACALLETSRTFILNVLGQSDNILIKRFSKPPKGEPVFEGLSVQRLDRGIAVLSDAISYLECELINQIKVQDHSLYVGKVVGGGLLKGGDPYVHIRKTGLSY